MSSKSKQNKSSKRSKPAKKCKNVAMDDYKLLNYDEKVGTTMKEPFEESELNELFEKFLDDLEIKDDKRMAMLKIDSSLKVMMLSKNKNIRRSTPAHYIELLNEILTNKLSDSLVVQNLESVWISLKSYNVSWVKQFYEPPNNGMNVLIELLIALNNKPFLALVCLKCFRAFGNCGFGFFKLMENKIALFNIATWLQPENDPVMSIAIEILTPFLFYSNYSHRNVLEALDEAAKVNKYENQFVPLIKGVNVFTNDEKGQLSLSCLRFINVIVNPNFQMSGSSQLPTYYRLHLRRQFVKFGLLVVFKSLESREDINKTRELINMFQEDYEIESSENQEEAEDLIASFGDCNKIFEQLRISVSNSAAETTLWSILGSLLMIKNDPIRDSLYVFIDKIITEIILQTENDDFCPDPTLRTFNEINIKKILMESVIKENVKLKSQLIDEQKDYDDLKRQFIAYKVDNPCKNELKNVSTFKGRENQIR